MQRRTTQKDVARALGLDKSTVSLALRNHPSIPIATRERVKAKATELGYRPDPAIATLARQRWAGHETGSGATFAYLLDSHMEHHELHRRFLPACRERAHARGYQLQEFDLAAYPSMASASRVLFHRGIRGLLVPQIARTHGPRIDELEADKFTVVCLDQGWVTLPYHLVAPDTFAETLRVWREAVDRGYRRIGGAILTHTPRAVDDVTRLGASMAAQDNWVSAADRIPLLTSDSNDREAFLAWMKRHQPEVVIGFVSRVYFWLREAGYRIPDDVAVASLLVVVPEAPELAGCVAHHAAIGDAGVDALIAAIHEGEWGRPVQQRKLLLQPIWNEGSTLPRRG